MRETGRSAGSLDHVTIRRRVSEPMRPISVRRVVTDGSSERGTTTGRCITDGSRTDPYYRGSHRRRRGDGEKGAAGRDHDGAGEGPDTALATLAAEPVADTRLGFPPRSGGFCKEPKHPRRMEWRRNEPGGGSPASIR